MCESNTSILVPYVYFSPTYYINGRLSRELIACAWVKESTIAHRITNKMHASEKDGESVVSECVARACVCSCSLRHSMLLFTTALAIHINPYTTTERAMSTQTHTFAHMPSVQIHTSEITTTLVQCKHNIERFG